MTGRYKAYPKMASASEVIIENHPEHWILTRVKFNSIVKARVGWHGLKSDDFTEVGPYLVTGSDFKGKFIQWEHCYHCDEERYDQDENIQLKNGDLLLTKDGTIGKVALVSGLDGKATLNSGVFVVRPITDEYTTQFYYWLLLSRAFTDFVDYYKTGSTIAHLYQDTFVNFKFPLPPLVEQQKIANFLDHETAKIDTLITKQERLIELLKEKRQAVISHAVTKGLNPQAPMKDSGVEWLGEVPEHWVVSKLGLYAHKIGSGKTPKGGADVYQESGVLFLRSQNVYDDGLRISGSEATYISDLIHSEMANTSVKPFDVLLNITGGSIGRTCIVPATFCEANVNQHVCILRFAKRNAPYFANVMKSSAIKEQIEVVQVGGNREGLNFEQIANMKVCIPPKDEMNQINKFIQSQLCKFDELVRKADNAIALMKERKTALISAAVTGKIDVRNWQPQGVQG
ncbi:hypothetical protein CGJ21_00075 [Vibrio parahaemolyticus]|uniref:restriction endonuclease subunit S n=1 Tax=Vibrio parahaemolyticus TaxID=670 RepID=UPI001122E5D8|nr:restriction endonuclease subunit S [Vibrio parahaemolyticus]TOF38191.1 hypothetical protein CGJ23_15205 [Vibrio parahaemolyticus]TOF51392.1 hypothetical protein CGJ21_00075 [Vibrio parahaemolyticus]